jgi:hypothetical protein
MSKLREARSPAAGPTRSRLRRATKWRHLARQPTTELDRDPRDRHERPAHGAHGHQRGHPPANGATTRRQRDRGPARTRTTGSTARRQRATPQVARPQQLLPKPKGDRKTAGRGRGPRLRAFPSRGRLQGLLALKPASNEGGRPPPQTGTSPPEWRVGRVARLRHLRARPPQVDCPATQVTEQISLAQERRSSLKSPHVAGQPYRNHSRSVLHPTSPARCQIARLPSRTARGAARRWCSGRTVRRSWRAVLTRHRHLGQLSVTVPFVLTGRLRGR